MKKLKSTDNLLQKDYLIYSILFLFVCLTSFIRFMPILQGDFPFLFDHGRDMLEVKKIVVDHKQTLIGPFTGMQGVFQGPLHYYLLAIPFALSGGHPAGGVVLTALFGVLGTIASFFVGRKMGGRLMGLFAAFFFAIAPASIAFSQHFWNPHWIPFFMIFFMYFLYKAVFGNNCNWMVVGFIGGIIAQSEFAFGGMLFLAIFFYALFFNRSSLTKPVFWASFLFYLLTFLPQVLFDIRHSFLMTKSILFFLKGGSQGLGGAVVFPQRLFIRINELQSATIFAITPEKALGYLLLIFVIGYLVVSFVHRNTKDFKLIMFFFALPLIYFLGFLFYSHAAWSWYWIGLQVPTYLLASFVLSQTCAKRETQSIVIVIFLVIYFFNTIPRYGAFHPLGEGATGAFRNEIRVIDAVYKDAGNTKFNVLVLAIERDAERLIVPSTDLKFEKDDKITLVGKTEDIKHFAKHFKMK